MSPTMQGKYWLVPAETYPAIRQAAVVVKASRQKAAARKFLEYVKSDEGREILRKYGFEKL
jgi:molybdate transport system substrate-binding protein